MNANGTRREPAWEKRLRGPYIIVLIIALLLSAACLYFWRQERAEVEAAIAQQFAASAGRDLPWIAKGITDANHIYGKMWHIFIDKINRATVNNRDDKYIAGLSNQLFNSDADIFRAWVILEPDNERGKPPLAVMSERGSEKQGARFIQDITEGGYYAAAREKNSISVRLAARDKIEPGAKPPADNGGKPTLTLQVYGPVTSGGNFAGAAGFEVDFGAFLDLIYEMSRITRLDLFLADPDGNPVVSSFGGGVEGQQPDVPPVYSAALTAIAEKIVADGGFDWLLSRAGDERTVAAFVPIDAGDGGPPWIIAILAGMDAVQGVGRVWLIAIIFVWLAAVFAMLIIHRAGKRPKASDTGQAL